MAPPIYKPLAVSQTAIPAAIQEIFKRQEYDLNDAIKKEQAADAGSIANSLNQIKLEETQRAADQEKALRDELIKIYGSEGSQEFNADDALNMAQKVALGQGDLDTALNVEKIQDNRFTNKTPLTPERRALFEQELGYAIPDGMTAGDVTNLINLRGKNLYGQQLSDNKEKDQRNLHSLAPGGWEATIDQTSGQAPTKDDGRKFTATVSAYNKVNNYLDQLTDSISKGGGNDPTDPEFVRQRQLLGGIQVAFKEKNNFGAALTANEQAINDAQLPVLLANPNTSIAKALVESGMGRTPQEAIANLKLMLNGELESQAMTYKFKPKALSVQPADSTTPMIPKASQDSKIGTSYTHPQLGNGTILRKVR